MNSIFSIDDLSDPFWLAAAAALSPDPAAAAGMNRSQSEWAFEKCLEEISASVTGSLVSVSSSSAADDPIDVSPAAAQSQPSVSRPGGREAAEDVDDVIEIKKHQNHDRLRLGNQDHSPPSDLSPEILKTKLDLACKAAVALRDSAVKPEDSGFPSAGNQIQAAQLGSSRAQGSPLAQSEVGASSACVSVSPTEQKKQNAQTRQATSGSSREDSDDDDLDGETEITENMDPGDIKRARRMLSNRESARRSRRRKQEQTNELETQVGQLRVEHSSLLKRLSDMNHKYDEAAVGNRILKADIETLRAKVKMAEETVKRVTGVNPLLLPRSSIPSSGIPFISGPMDTAIVAALKPQPHPSGPNHAGPTQTQRLASSFSGNTLVPPNVNPQSTPPRKNPSETPHLRHMGHI